MALQQVQVMFNPFSGWPRGNSFTCEVKGLYKPCFSYQSQPLSKRFLEVPALLQVDEALKIWDDLAKRQHLRGLFGKDEYISWRFFGVWFEVQFCSSTPQQRL